MKRKLFLGLCMATFIVPVARAQYPQITEEAKQAYQKMMSEERRRSDEAWAKALPVVLKEAKRRSSVYFVGFPSIRFAAGTNSCFPRC